MTITLPWTEDQIDALREAYANGTPLREIALNIGRTVKAVRNKACSLGITTSNAFTPEELEEIERAYKASALKGELGLDALAKKIGRSKTSICRKAQSMGLTDAARKWPEMPKRDTRKYKTEEERSAARTAALRKRHKEVEHPMKGKRHTPEALEKISQKAKQAWAAAGEEKRAEWVDKSLRGRLKNHGTIAPQVKRGSWKAGWRHIGGKRNYYRSRWEANYARYLQWLKDNGEIQDWQHEPETFWFEAIKRGVRSYKPDFRVWENDDQSRLHEVKGYMDSRSKTTLRRMAKYHPNEEIVLIREKQYNQIARKVGPLIDGWECGGRADRP